MYIETENLIVRNFKLEDKDDLCEYMLQRVDEKFEGYPWFSKDKAQGEIENRSKSEEFFAIELKANHKVIGNVYLGKRDFNTLELGYVLNKGFQRKGYGYEACKVAVDYMFAHGTRRIYAETCPQNTASFSLMEKLGMRREALFIQNISFYNDDKGNPVYLDTYEYALLADEWKKYPSASLF